VQKFLGSDRFIVEYKLEWASTVATVLITMEPPQRLCADNNALLNSFCVSHSESHLGKPDLPVHGK